MRCGRRIGPTWDPDTLSYSSHEEVPLPRARARAQTGRDGNGTGMGPTSWTGGARGNRSGVGNAARKREGEFGLAGDSAQEIGRLRPPLEPCLVFLHPRALSHITTYSLWPIVSTPYVSSVTASLISSSSAPIKSEFFFWNEWNLGVRFCFGGKGNA